MVAAGSANSQRPKHQRDTRHRNGLIVLMILILLKELSCPPGFQTDPIFFGCPLFLQLGLLRLVLKRTVLG